VATERSVWRDDLRGRSVPIKLYYPVEAGETGAPTIVFSHGLGGSREGCAYLGRQWASHGFTCLHPQHSGSDENVWRGKIRPRRALKSSFEDPANLEARVADLRFVLDSLDRHVANKTPLGQMIDPGRIGVAGHAFGALAALVLAGQDTGSDGDEAGGDSRVQAVLSLSSPVLFNGPGYDEAYRGIRIPALHMTGTKDDSPVGPTRAVHRRIPFDHIRAADQFLVTFSGADHLTFSGHLRERASQNDPFYQARIKAASTAFWSAYLRDAPPQQARLAQGGMEACIGSTGRVEYKASAF
jgi:predicted dienelactone hydrolase